MAELLLYDYPGSICSQMARLALVEKGVPFARQTVDIMDRAEQFEPWYTALNPKAVVPTLRIGDEIVTDTIRIVHRVDRDFDGPSLTPPGAAAAAAMAATMDDIMGLNYGVLLYSRRLEADRRSPVIVARGRFLREELARHPDRAEILERRIAGNDRLQAILADPAEVDRHVGAAREVVVGLDGALAERPFVSAGQYSLADSFATAALARFRMHGFESWWQGGAAANVADYYRRMRERPSFAAAGVVETGGERDL
jgi:glutathione S-transferase